MNTKCDTNEEEDDGNLGDDEKEVSSPENVGIQNRRKIKCQMQQCDIGKRRWRRRRVQLDSSEEDLLRGNSSNSPDCLSSLWASNSLSGSLFRQSNWEESRAHNGIMFNSVSSPCYGLSNELHSSSLVGSSTVTASNSFALYRRKKLPPHICLECEQKPKNSLFAHVRIGHQIFCYDCAKMWWRSNDLCPFCNERILQVLQIFLI